ncbi:MAG: hypothetical protein HQ503_04910, partial [Rhodospirillales bacterium]|nr:hypothetical protein [Rhodospirillales bacterium]
MREGFGMERNWALPVIFTVMVLAGAGLYSARVVQPLIALLGLGIIWISLLPGAIYLASRDPVPIPFIPATGLFYAVFFGLPVFTIPIAWKDASSIILYRRAILPDIRAEVLVVVLVGIVGLIASFYVSRHYIFKRLVQFRFPNSMDQSNIKPLLWLLLISHQVFKFDSALFNVFSIGQFLDPAGYVAFGGLYLLWQRKSLHRTETLLLVLVFFPIEIYLRLRFLFLTDVIYFLIFIIFILWREQKYGVLSLCAVAIFLILSTYNVSGAVRWKPQSGIEKLIIAAKTYTELMIYGKEELRRGEFLVLKDNRGGNVYFEGKFGSLVKRTSQLWVFHIVDDKAPQTTPYWQGESYLPIFTSFIPRAIYPGKREERVGYKFGSDFGFILPEDRHMSINLPWITEMLVNFGKQGVIFGMILGGVFLAFLDRLFNARKA